MTVGDPLPPSPSPPPPPEPKPKAKAKAKARTKKPKEEIIVDPVEATTVKFGIENKTNPVLPTKPVRLTKAKPPAPEVVPEQSLQSPPQAPVTKLSPDQLMGIINNQRMMKAQRKQQRIQSLVSHAF